jgi:hypothetical protein
MSARLPAGALAWPEFRDASHRRARRLSPEFAGFMEKLEGGNA